METNFCPLSFKTHLNEYGPIAGILGGTLDGNERNFEGTFDGFHKRNTFERILDTHCHNSGFDEILFLETIEGDIHSPTSDVIYITYGRILHNDVWIEMVITIYMQVEYMECGTEKKTLLDVQIEPEEIIPSKQSPQ